MNKRMGIALLGIALVAPFASSAHANWFGIQTKGALYQQARMAGHRPAAASEYANQAADLKARGLLNRTGTKALVISGDVQHAMAIDRETRLFEKRH